MQLSFSAQARNVIPFFAGTWPGQWPELVSRRQVSGSIYKTVRVWHATTASPVLTYTGHDNHQNLSSTVLSVTWSPDSKHIASAGQDVTVQIWEALSGKRISTYRGYNANVYAALWSLNSQYIASGGDDGTVQVWQAV